MVSLNYRERLEEHVAWRDASAASGQAGISKRPTRLSGTRVLQLLLAFCLALLLPAGTAVAQSANGLISGKVEDPTGAAVPGALVTVTNQLTAVMRSTQTNETGYFVLPEIPPGIYTISVEKEGFERFEKTGIVVYATESRPAGIFQLKVGSTKTVVEVTGQSNPVQTTSSALSTVITSTEMAALPVLGNDFMSLTRIIPGSTYLGEGNSSLSLNSTRPGFMGISDNNNAYLSSNGTNASTFGQGYDAAPTVIANIQDMRVMETGYEPEYGLTQGAVITVTTKSGTQAFHGSLWYASRNEALNANDFFSNRVNEPRSRYRYNTITGTLGGPLLFPGHLNRNRNKLFFFFSYDNEPSTTPQGLFENNFPTAAERNGDFSQAYIPGSLTQTFTVLNPLTHQPYPGNVIPSNQINPTMSKVMDDIFPMPNYTNTAVSLNDYNWVMPGVLDSPTNQESLRLDYAATDKWHVFGRWQRSFFENSSYSEPGVLEDWDGPQSYDNGTERFELNTTYSLNPHMVNELAVGYTIWHEYNVFPQSLLQDFEMTSLGINFPQQYPQTNPYGLIPAMSFADGASFGYLNRFPMDDHYYGGSINDNFSYVYKNHQFQFGIMDNLTHQTQPHHAGGGNLAGGFDFDAPNPNNPYNAGDSYAEGLLGYFDTFSDVTNLVDDVNSAYAFQWYAQDKWQATKRLSLNFGSRFSYDIPQDITGGQGGVIDFQDYNPANAPKLYQPVLVNGVQEAEDPLTGAVLPAAYLNQYVNGSGTYAPGTVTIGSPNWHGVFNSTGIQFEPRFGFAYELTGDGKTALRGDIGNFYNPIANSGYMYDFITNPPVQDYPTQYYGTTTNYSTVQGVLSPSTSYYSPRNSKIPYSVMWSIGIQREVGFSSVLNVSYVGSVSRNAPYTLNIDEVPYGSEFLPQNQDIATGTPLPTNYYVPYPGYSAIEDQTWGDNANYNSLQVTLNRRVSHGLQYGVSYTWAKTLDDHVSTVFLPSTLTYGPSSTNMANRLIPYWTWDLPKASQRWNNLFSRGVLDNWQVSGILSFISGPPESATCGTTNGENVTGGGDAYQCIMTGNAVLPKGQRTFNTYFNTSAFALPKVYTPGAPLTAQYIGTQWTSSFYGPGVNDWDLALTKKIIIKERVHADLRFEFYNAWNHPSFNGVDASADFNPATGQQVNTAFGQLTSDMSPRVLQVALRLSF